MILPFLHPSGGGTIHNARLIVFEKRHPHTCVQGKNLVALEGYILGGIIFQIVLLVLPELSQNITRGIHQVLFENYIHWVQYFCGIRHSRITFRMSYPY
jgi:hypothetical protein